ncbi:MAG: TRAP transporter small permease [Pseudomonadota bacterium]
MSSSLLKRLEQVSRLTENAVLILLLLSMIVLAAGQIILRNVFDTGIIWTDELLRILVLWLGLAGAVVASRDRRHIKIDVLSRFLNDSWQRIAGVVTCVFTAFVCALVAWHAGVFVSGTFQFGDTVMGGAPAWIFQSILPIGFGLIAYRYLVYGLATLLGKELG